MGIVAGTCLVFEGLGGSGKGAYVFKGSVDTYDDLVEISDAWTDKEKENNAGWVYNVRDTGKNYAWNGTSWDDIGGTYVEGAGITITSASESNVISVTGADSATNGQFAVSDGNDSITWRQPVAADLSDITATATELNYTDGVTSSIQDQLDDRVKHYEQLPVASAENADEIVQYIGETNANYTKGYFYKCNATTTYNTTVTFEPSQIAGTVCTCSPEDFTAWLGTIYGLDDPTQVASGDFGFYSGTPDTADATYSFGLYDSEHNVLKAVGDTVENLEAAGFTFTPYLSAQDSLTFTCSVNAPVSTYAWEQIDTQPRPVKTVNHVDPDAAGNVELTPQDVGAVPETDVAEVTGAISTVIENNLTAGRAVISNNNGKIDVSAVTSTELGYLDDVTSPIQTQFNDITSLIPNDADPDNQLADKEFVNSSISTETAHFIGTFNNISALEAYAGDVTNNDYAFVINQLVTDSGNDWTTFSALDAYDKDLLTNLDYAWVVNGTKFDLYRFDIINQDWELRAQAVDKEGISLNTAYNRYKATVTDDNPPVVTWEYEYTLNNSSFTATQWKAINSGATDTLINQITTNQTAIGTLSSLTTTEKSNLVGAINELETNKADTTDIGNATITFKANGSTIAGQSFTTNASTDVEIDLGNTGLVDDVKIDNTSIVSNKIATIPYATNAVAGVAKAGSGLASMAGGVLYIYPATDAAIQAKTNNANPIVPKNLDKAIREGLGNYDITNSGEWTDAFKEHARDVIGTTQVVVRDWS